jgi:spore germination protein YaaH
LRKAHSLGEKSELLFGNFDDTVGNFSDSTAEKMFDSPAKMRDVINDISSEVSNDGWNGVTVDLEALNNWGASPGVDNAGLDSFLKNLKSELGRKSVSICLTATTDSYALHGYDLATIAAQADHVVLMAYDQHGPTWSNAGPVGGYPWVSSSLDLLLEGLPAAKIQLGIAGYGYSWTHGTRESGSRSPALPSLYTDQYSDQSADQYTDAQARARVKSEKATAHWDSTQKEWHATFADGTVIWWSDARSYAARKALAQSLHLGGVAVWNLSGADPLS